MKSARDQGDAGLAFNGQGGQGYSRGSNKYCHNQSGLTAKENYGRGPTRGNHDTRTAGPAEVRGVNAKYNSDAINVGRGPTNAGGLTGVRHPANPDMISVGRGPTRGNQK